MQRVNDKYLKIIITLLAIAKLYVILLILDEVILGAGGNQNLIWAIKWNFLIES